MAKVNKTKYAILGVLNIEPASGYDIKKFCDHSINHFWSENYGHIYPVLKQLESDGWVTKTENKHPSGPNRNVYTITPIGKTALVDWLHIPPEVPQVRYEFLLKMFFSAEIPIEVTLKRMVESKSFCEELLQGYQQIETHIQDVMQQRGPEGDDLFFKLATVHYGVLNMKATIDWCEYVIENLMRLAKRSVIHESSTD